MTAIYHITHVSNLERIIRTNGLWCDAQRLQQGFDCLGIAHQTLKDRRARTAVRAAGGGTLADYVPFYFTNRSPMLYSIHKGFVQGYDGGQKDIIHLESSVERVAQGKRPWCFTDGHAVEAMTDYYADVADLNRVDWAVIDHWSWKNTEEDPDRKRRKQAGIPHPSVIPVEMGRKHRRHRRRHEEAGGWNPGERLAPPSRHDPAEMVLLRKPS